MQAQVGADVWRSLVEPLVTVALSTNSSQDVPQRLPDHPLERDFALMAELVGLGSIALLLGAVLLCCAWRSCRGPPPGSETGAPLDRQRTTAVATATRRVAAARATIPAVVARSASVAPAADAPADAIADLKRQKLRGLLEQAICKQKVEDLRRAIAAHEERLHHAPSAGPPSADQSQGRTYSVPGEAQDRAAQRSLKAETQRMMLERGVVSALAYGMPLVMQGQKLYEAVEKQTKSLRDKATRIAYEEARALFGEVCKVFEVDGVTDRMFAMFADMEIPSVAVLVASAIAPAQLRCLYFVNWVGAWLVGINVALTVLVLIIDSESSCLTEKADMHNAMRFWFAVSCLWASTFLLIRVPVLVKIEAVLKDVGRPEDFLVAVAVDPLSGVRDLLDHHITAGGEALLRLDGLSNSWLFRASNLFLLFECCWMAWATDLALNTPWHQCSTFGIVVLRLRVIVFLVMLPVLLPALMFFALELMSHSSRAYHALLRLANTLDQYMGLGVPLFNVLARALLIREVTDMVNLELRAHKMERSRLEREQLRVQQRLQAIAVAKAREEVHIERLRGQRRRWANTGRRSQAFRAQQEQMKAKILEESENMFRQMNERARQAAEAANEQVEAWERGEGPDMLQALARGELGSAQAMEMAREVARSARDAARVLQEEEWVKHATTRALEAAAAAKEFAEGVAEDERIQRMVTKGRAAYERGAAKVAELASDERVQMAIHLAVQRAVEVYEQGLALAAGGLEDERLQRALAQGRHLLVEACESAAAHAAELVHSEAMQHALAAAEQARQRGVAVAEEVASHPAVREALDSGRAFVGEACRRGRAAAGELAESALVEEALDSGRAFLEEACGRIGVITAAASTGPAGLGATGSEGAAEPEEASEAAVAGAPEASACSRNAEAVAACSDGPVFAPAAPVAAAAAAAAWDGFLEHPNDGPPA